jgi:putative DNA primase/helicase
VGFGVNHCPQFLQAKPGLPLRNSWLRLGPNGIWVSTIADRGAALVTRKLEELASRDFPVASDNAKELVAYLHTLEALNQVRIPRAQISSHLGWLGKGGQAGFLWGHTFLHPDGVQTSEVDLEDVNQWQAHVVAFKGVTSGDEQIASGYHGAGTFEGWRDAISILRDYPKARLIFYSSFVAPLLDIIDCPNFAVETFDRTSTGKTSALRGAASVWGCPDEESSNTVLHTWDITRVFQERVSSIISSMPLVLDDTKRTKNPHVIEEILYSLASGHGRGRGNTKSLSQTRHWRTVLISSGEAPAASYTQAGGARTRILEIRGLPFGKDDPATGRLVMQLNSEIKTHYGHAGPRFVQWLMQHRDEWPEFKKDYQRSVREFAACVEDPGPESGRLASYAAAISLAASLTHEALDLPWELGEPISWELWQAITAEASDAAGEIRSLRDVMAWAHSNEQAFYGRERMDSDGERIPPHGGWAGRWDKGNNWQFIGFFRPVLARVLSDLGYEPEGILGLWRERGWINTEGDRKRFEKRVRIKATTISGEERGGERVWLVVIPRTVLNAVGTDADTSQE